MQGELTSPVQALGVKLSGGPSILPCSWGRGILYPSPLAGLPQACGLLAGSGQSSSFWLAGYLGCRWRVSLGLP